MYKYRLVIVSFLFSLILGCEKSTNYVTLPENSVTFASDKDTIQVPLSILKDSAIVFNIQAALKDVVSNSDHHITFSIDSTKLVDYKDQYGEAKMVPNGSYLFYKSNVRIKSGESVSDNAELNIGLQTKLMEYSTYVLPIIIKSVDGIEEGVATSKTLYLVFKTGKPLLISRTGWTIEGYSSHFNTFVPTNLIDNNDVGTYWASDITQTYPQWVTINFNRDIIFNGVNYNLPTILNYPTLGGYPTSIKIETSMDGNNWVDKGTYAGNVVNNTQTINIGETTARFLRYTVLAGVKYGSAYDAVFISGISLNP